MAMKEWVCPGCGKKQHAIVGTITVEHVCPNATAYAKREYDGLMLLVEVNA